LTANGSITDFLPEGRYSVISGIRSGSTSAAAGPTAHFYPHHFAPAVNPHDVYYYQSQPNLAAAAAAAAVATGNMALVGHPSAVVGSQIFTKDSSAANGAKVAAHAAVNGITHHHGMVKPGSSASMGATAVRHNVLMGGHVNPSETNHLVKTLLSAEQNGYLNEPSSPKRTEPDRPIGYGAFGVVWSVTDPRNHKRVALKKMPNVFQNLASCKRVFREVKMLESFKHDNVLGLLDILQPPNQNFFQEIYVLTELMQSDLHKIIVSPQQLTTDHIKVFVYQILRGLKYLHSANILHRDIKPGNLLVNSNCILKICDYGLARIWDPLDSQNMTHEVVTQYYRAPELLMGVRKYTGAVDVWSVGCIFAELLGRRILFQAQGPVEQLNLIIDLLGTPQPEEMRGAVDGAKAHILRSPYRQPSLYRLNMLSQQTTPEAVTLLQEMLRFDPAKRMSVDEALKHSYLEEGRMRFHSCMCSCCFTSPKRERVFTKVFDPCHERPFDPLWEKELSRISMFDLRERLFKFVTERTPMFGIPLCINTNSATYGEFANSCVAQPSELPPSPNAWD
jgi:nemo like kinase